MRSAIWLSSSVRAPGTQAASMASSTACTMRPASRIFAICLRLLRTMPMGAAYRVGRGARTPAVTESTRRHRTPLEAILDEAAMQEDAVLHIKPLGFPWETSDPFLFCVHHDDRYPAGNQAMGPAASLAGRDLGQDFEGKDGWRMYHGEVVPGFPQ